MLKSQQIRTNSSTKTMKRSLIKISITKKKENFVTNFLIGGLSGSIAKTAVAPTERIKLIL
jgi:hypothetical protein